MKNLTKCKVEHDVEFEMIEIYVLTKESQAR